MGDGVAKVLKLDSLSPARDRSWLAAELRRARWSRDVVIDLATHHEFPYDDPDRQRSLLERVLARRWKPLRSLAFIHGHYQRGHKTADPDHDGYMGWITEHRDTGVGSHWAPMLATIGLPRSLRSFAFADGDLDGKAIEQITRALPTDLELLDLSHNNLEPRGIAALCARPWPALRALRVGFPNLDLAALRTTFGDRLIAIPSTTTRPEHRVGSA